MRWSGRMLPVLAMVVAVAGCEEFPIFPPDPDEDTVRRLWYFSSMSLAEQQAGGWQRMGDPGRQLGGVVFEEFLFGPAALDLSDGQANGVVSSGQSGFEHFTSAEAPYTPEPDSAEAIAGRSTLIQYQRFEKTEADAELQYVISDVYLEALDTNGGAIISEFECPWQDAGDPAVICERLLWAWVTLDVDVMRVPAEGWCAELDDDCLFRANGRADLFGWFDNWTLEVMATGLQPDRLWQESDFRLEDSSNDELSHARGLLDAPVTVDIPLDNVAIGDTIEVRIVVESAALNHRQSETESFVFAHLRDLGGASGLEFSHQGLEPVETPEREDDPPEVDSAPVTQCVGSGGVVELTSGSFHAPEWPVGRAPVLLRRTGGTGPMSVLLSTSAGTATPGQDYRELSTHVIFGGGGDETRAIDLPLLGDDDVEGHETIQVQISTPACGSLGGQTSATFTIYDDDRESAPSYSVGGTVSGLAGSGLILSNQGRRLDITQNGPFVFSGGWPANTPYDVVVAQQPGNPAQVCTVENGSGTIGEEHIENVSVTCTTPGAGSGVDVAFGTDGRLWTALVPNSIDVYAADVAVHLDGVLVLGEGAMARYTADGALDTGFGMGGSVSVDVFGSLYDQAHALEVLADGRILVAGSARDGANSPTRDEFVVSRFNADGTLDTSFGNGGSVVTDFEGLTDAAADILVQPDGSIVLAGTAYSQSGTGRTDANFALARFTSDGTPDLTFGPGGTGRAIADGVGDDDVGEAAALMPDGRILVVGRAMRWNVSQQDVGMVMFDASGNVDQTFGNNGVVHFATDASDQYYDVAIDQAGRIVVSGWHADGAASSALIARFDANGELDPGFGSGGQVTSSLLWAGNGIAIDATGNILVVGATPEDYGVVRLLEDGTVDTSLGDAGLVSADFYGGYDEASDLAIQPDGRVIVAGVGLNGLTRRVGVIRVIP